MIRRALLLCTLGAGFAARLPADFSYRRITTISGIGAGGMAGLPGQPAAPGPIDCTLAVKDGRLLARFAGRATVIDLSAQTVMEIDFTRRAYSVANFDEIRRALAPGAAALKPTVKATGERRQISGFDASEVAMKLEAPGAEMGPVTRDLWLAPAPAGYSEMRDLLRRIAAAVEWSPLQRLFPARPEVVGILAALFRETAMAEGMPVLEVTVIEPPPQLSEGPRPRLATGNPLSQLGGGIGSNAGPLFHIRTEMSGFSSAVLDEADFAAPSSFRRVPAEILQPAKK